MLQRIRKRTRSLLGQATCKKPSPQGEAKFQLEKGEEKVVEIKRISVLSSLALYVVFLEV